MSGMNVRSSSFGERLFRIALRALPAHFRSQYESEIIGFQRERIHQSRVAGSGAGVAWGPAIWDALKEAFLLRVRSISAAVKGWGRFGRRRGGTSAGRGGGPPGPDRLGSGLWLDLLLQDIRFAARGLRRSKGFTAVAVFSLALGTGATTAFFSLLQETYLKPIPGVHGAERVVELVTTQRGAVEGVMSYPDLEDLKRAEVPLAGIATWRRRSGTLATPDGGEAVRLMYVSHDYFNVLGVAPTMGRGLLPEEDAGAGEHPVAIVSHTLWMDRLGGAENVVGSTLILDRIPHTVVGVSPPDFTGHQPFSEPVEIWVPSTQDPWVAGTERWTSDRSALWLRALARMEDGATLDEANAALQTVFSRFEELNPESNAGRRARAFALGTVPATGRTEASVAVIVVAALAGLVLLIICGNVAGMTLARGVSREHEIAVRMALGSGRRRVARLLLVEALLLAVAGGAAGMILGVWGISLCYGFLPVPQVLSFSVEAPVISFALGLTVFTTVVVGLIPAVRFSRPDLLSSLKEDARGGGRRAGRLHRVSASAQAGGALMLLVIGSLFLRALDAVEQKDLGFRPDGLVTTSVDLLQGNSASRAGSEAFLEQVSDRLTAIPGVTSVAFADGIPMDLSGNFASVERADQPDGSEGRIRAEFARITEGYFETIGTPLLQGRGIEVRDDEASEPVMVITESLAARLWPGEGVLGRRVRSRYFGEGPEEFTVIGVIPEVASSRASEDWPNVFVALRQTYQPRVMIVIRTAGEVGSIAPQVQAAILETDPSLSFPALVSSETLVRRSTQGQRWFAWVAEALGALALLLSAIGVYGVVAFAVSRRTREIGLRMAVGSTRGEILRGVLLDAVRLAIPGLLLGGVLSALLAAALRSALFGLDPMDPFSFATATGVLFLVVLLASLAPARTASGIDPIVALRSE